MVDHQSKEVIDKISDELKIQPSLSIPREISKNIQLVYNVNPDRKRTIIASATRTTSSGQTIFTTPATRNFFLTSMTFDVIKDSACDIATGDVTIRVVKDGLTIDLLRLSVITLTTQDKVVSVTFDTPIQLDRNTLISFATDTFTLGVMVRTASLTGYETDPQ